MSNYALIRSMDIANGEGIRASLFVSGCKFNCNKCFNKKFQDFNYGEKLTNEVIDKFVDLVNKPHIVGATILGGEPLVFENRDMTLKIINRLKEKAPTRSIWVYSGYKYEDILLNFPEVLYGIDILVDGQFIEELKDLNLKFKGSSNQRIIKVKESLKERKVILWEE